MYRVQNVFKMITQLSLVADASTHSGKEILVSCAYSPGQSLGCHAVIQHLNTGSLKPSEVNVSVLARIAKNRKLQRMSAFRQLQAIDKQLALLSDNRLRLDAFSLNDVVEMEKMKKTLLNQKRKKEKNNATGTLPCRNRRHKAWRQHWLRICRAYRRSSSIFFRACRRSWKKTFVETLPGVCFSFRHCGCEWNPNLEDRFWREIVWSCAEWNDKCLFADSASTEILVEICAFACSEFGSRPYRNCWNGFCFAGTSNSREVRQDSSLHSRLQACLG